MLLNKSGFPEEDELVLCSTTNIFHHGVFVNLDEYGKSGMIHISEVSPGRIRNIRDFVKEGKKIVCKVLRVDKEKGHIDLSLRRVNERQKKEKINEIKQEQKAEKIVEFTAKKLDIGMNKFYYDVFSKISKSYPMLYYCFEDVVKGEISLENLGIEKKAADTLTECIKERMKPQKVFVRGTLNLSSYSDDGVEIIKSSLGKALEQKDVTVLYEGAGKYKVTVTADEYKDAEKILEESTRKTIDFLEEHGGTGEFVKSE
ncbi:translation initiation factor IF-2 subunit alpha [Candidatus Woesearchaeota archaeon]|nr:translation initiation factor IF-2 subunit alpha [Candidatus Woesearchaeota archaeon]